MVKIDSVAYVLGGGRGSRLKELGDIRAKPALPFGGTKRVIDFPLSNLYHSGIRRVYVLTQFESDSLHRHIRDVHYNKFGNGSDEHLMVLPAIQGNNSGWFKGTADAVFQKRDYILKNKKGTLPDVVNVLAGDHVYFMDFSQLNEFHIQKNSALTIATIPVSVEEAKERYGVIIINNPEERKVIGFEEKPKKPTPIPDNKDFCLTSMGIYAFHPEVLLMELENDSQKLDAKNKKEIIDFNKQSTHDFGFDIIPNMLKKGLNISAYPFETNKINGFDKPSWFDIGTIKSFYDLNMDLKNEIPLINMYNPYWEIITSSISTEPAKIVSKATSLESILSPGVIICDSAKVKDSVLSYNCFIQGSESLVENSILLGRNKVINAKIKNAIIDKDVSIPEGTRIGYNLKEDLENNLTTVDGITIIPKGYIFNTKKLF